MMWGMTYAEQAQYAKGHRWFAWYPVQITDGRWVWWVSVKRYLRAHHDGDGMPCLQWHYKLKGQY